MGDGLSLNIQKLGHELEEIRVRALESIISKLNLGVLNTEILIDHPDLYFNLINWFNQCTVPCRASVLNLILRLCKTDKDVVNQFLRYDPGFKILHSSVRNDEKAIFNELCDLAEITFPETSSDKKVVPESNENIYDEVKLETVSERQQYDFTFDSLDKPTILTSSQTNYVTKSDKTKNTESSGKVLWPALQLDHADTSVLNTVYMSLRDPSQSAQAVYFFTTVVLHDFPPQVFLHNTAILSALFDLHASDCCDQYILQCFRSLTKSLIKQFNYNVDPAIISANVTKAAPEILTEDIGASGDSVLNQLALSPNSTVSHSIVGPLSLEDFCGLLLERLDSRVPEVLKLLNLCIIDFNTFWNEANPSTNFLKASISSVLVKLARTLNNAKSINAISRLEAQLSVYKILKTLVPLDISMTVVPKELQEVLTIILLDPVLYLLFPNVHKLFLAYVETFKYQKETVYKDYEEIGQSLEEGAHFLYHSTEMNMNELFKAFKSSLPGLEFHQQYRIIPVFIDIITSKYELEPSYIEAAQEITLLLLSSSDDHIKSSTYESCCEVISKFLGPNKCLSSEDPLPRLSFVINNKALTEIVSFGLTSNDIKICKWAETILTLTLKCQMLLPALSWARLVDELTSVLPLLQAFSSQSTVLGRTIISTLDPDMSKILHLTDMQVLIGNLRLMFSKDLTSYEEAKIRLMYMLDITASAIVLNQLFNFSEDALQGKTNPPSNFAEESLLRVLEVISSCSDDDRALIKSALTQLSLIMQDHTLHIVFLDNHGLDMVIKLLFASTQDLEEDCAQVYSSSVAILRNLARYNIQLRHDFAINYQLYCCILKGLFVFNTEWRIQRDVAQLLALMAYSDVILTTIDTVSFPEVLFARIRIPFESISHAKVSQYTLPSKRSRLQENKTVEKSLALRWCLANCKGGIEEAITKELEDLPQAPFLVVSLQSFRDLKESHIVHNLRGYLQSFAMANSHKSASVAIFLLNRYLKMKEITSGEDELNDLPWESSFLRYLTTLPASVPDQKLLVAIIRLLTTVVDSLPCQNKWIISLLQDPSSVLCTLLTQILVADSTPLDKELSVEILTLIETCLNSTDGNSWDHTVKILVQCLSQSHTHKFYSLAIMDKLLTCLLKMTSMKLVFNPQPLWLLMNAFHCSSPNSYMGITITRLTLLCLCNLLTQKHKNKSKDWLAAECKWLNKLLASRDLLVKSATLELISGLCFDSAATSTLMSLLPTLWTTSLSVLIDHNEASLAREQAAILCSNIIITSQNKGYVKSCSEVGLFGFLAVIAARFDYYPVKQNTFFQDFSLSTNAEELSSEDSVIVSSITTPGLLIACCNLVLNLMTKEKSEVANLASSQGFILELFRQVHKWQSCKTVYSQDVVDMYTSVGRLLVQFTDQPSATIRDCIPVLVWLLQDSTYTKNVNRSNLTVQMIHLIASIVNNQDDVKVIFTKEAMDSICSVINEASTSSLDLETAVSVTHLAPYLTSDVNIELIRDLRGNGLAERILLAGILGTSHAATQAALEDGYLEPLVERLKETYIDLAVIPPDIPRNKKANNVLYNLWVDVNLLTNFLAGCVEAKEICAHLGLADSIHKIWAWCLLDVALLCSLLQALINFTADSALAASTLVLTSTMAGVGQRKCPTSNSLLHAVITLHSKEIYGIEVKKLLLELMVHACQAQECRVVMNKTNMLSEFLKLQHQKKTSALEEIEVAWLVFLEVYSSFVEGQTNIMKKNYILL
ncbi:rotatin-like isoform X2 [Rhodnius prolixus]|uniref:rotatin-like isoform X2 n=1 Tax=Rhodnius prolixus TaxID=13249 RepID=UPI003D1884C3